GVTIDGPVARAGEIQLTYPAERHTTRVRAMASELALVAIGVLVFAGLAGALLVRGLLHREIRGFAGVEAAIAAFERDAWRTAAGARVPVGGQEREMELRHMLEAAETRYRQAGQVLARSE
ncbi:MAG: hypothetical protein LPL29_05150, partial [Alphaproteobacteria bacterium]|nr:hypothetical protein [Alphaproteobacteria bacterium]